MDGDTSTALSAYHAFIVHFILAFVWTILVKGLKFLDSLRVFLKIMFECQSDAVDVLFVIADIDLCSAHVEDPFLQLVRQVVHVANIVHSIHSVNCTDLLRDFHAFLGGLTADELCGLGSH